MISKIRLVLISILCLLYPVQALALTSDQRFQIERENFYDPTACSQSISAPTSSNGSSSGKVFVIGDSISAGTASQITDALKNKGYSDVVIDALSSRRLSSGGDPLDGISVFENDKDKWKDANTIIIELGTNGTINTDNIKKIMQVLKSSNSGAQVYWVNIGVNNTQRPSNPIDYNSLNGILQQNTGEGYSIIDWASIVNQHPEYISDLGVHPFTADGRPAFANTVASGASSSSAGGVGGSQYGQCCDTVGSTALNGSDNKAKIHNYLIGKGLTPTQAAGIMGNMEAESSFDPTLVEYGFPNSRGEISTQGQPSSHDDVIPPSNSNGQPGYGIVQWSGGRKDGLQQLASSRSLKPSDLGVQLDYMWQELNGSYKYSVLDPIKASTSIEEATYIWLKHYEVPANIPGNKPIRLGMAQSILQEFGGGSSSASVGTDSGCGSSGAVSGTRAKIVEIAQQEFNAGASEANGQYTKYTMGRQEAWCADFVSWVMKEAGLPFKDGVDGWNIASAAGIQNHFEKEVDGSKWHPIGEGYRPRQGDVVVHNDDRGALPTHVNFVVSVDANGQITTLGGNEGNKIGKGQPSSTDQSGITGYGSID